MSSNLDDNQRGARLCRAHIRRTLSHDHLQALYKRPVHGLKTLQYETLQIVRMQGVEGSAAKQNIAMVAMMYKMSVVAAMQRECQIFGSATGRVRCRVSARDQMHVKAMRTRVLMMLRSGEQSAIGTWRGEDKIRCQAGGRESVHA